MAPKRQVHLVESEEEANALLNEGWRLFQVLAVSRPKGGAVELWGQPILRFVMVRES